MKQITLNIPDHKYEFFLELIQNLGLDKNGSLTEIEIPEEHKRIVMERIKKSKPENLIPWEEARKTLKFK